MKILKILLAILSIICLLNMPYGYYQLYRFVAMGIFFTIAFKEKKSENWMIFWVFSGLLVQPFLKIPLGLEIWNGLDVFWAITLVYSSFKKINLN